MILIDYNQIVIANVLAQAGTHTNMKLDTPMIRHTTLNMIRSIKQKNEATHGELVICCDHKHYWRKDFFPHYKAHRKSQRDLVDVDWGALFEALNTIREELEEYFPYRVIYVDGAEADDCIGTLVTHNGSPLCTDSNRILIVSGDKDFKQLQVHGNVSQYSPITKKVITEPDPEMSLKELIIRGDRGDGIPNILSPADSYVTGTRVKTMNEQRMHALMSHPNLEKHDDPFIAARFVQNRTLIDLSHIPASIELSILARYEAQAGKGRSKLFNYFVSRKLTRLMESIGDF